MLSLVEKLHDTKRPICSKLTVPNRNVLAWVLWVTVLKIPPACQIRNDFQRSAAMVASKRGGSSGIALQSSWPKMPRLFSHRSCSKAQVNLWVAFERWRQAYSPQKDVKIIRQTIQKLETYTSADKLSSGSVLACQCRNRIIALVSKWNIAPGNSLQLSDILNFDSSVPFKR